ncbi:MAG: CinA family protein [Gammaproteobacteria bacterium]|nr:CinA family protein [Gammaproteobacteria bacterium]
MLPKITKLAMAVGEALKKRSMKLVTAESCTGGMVGEIMTSISGASMWFDCGFITYSNESKIKLLKISRQSIQQFGAVSEQVAREMAEGALKHSLAQISLAITGIAGPAGGTKEKPVGTVWFAWAGKNFKTRSICQHFTGDREQIRTLATEFSLNQIIKFINTNTSIQDQ